QGNHDDSLLHEGRCVLGWCPRPVPPAVEIDHDGQLRVKGGRDRNRDIQSETILAADHLSRAIVIEMNLCADGGVSPGIANSLPWYQESRWLPAQFANRRGGIGNPSVNIDLIIQYAAYSATLCFYYGADRRV